MARMSDELEGLIQGARDGDELPSIDAQRRTWSHIEQRLAFGPPPVAIDRFTIAPAATGGKLVLVVAAVTWIAAAVLGGVAAAIVVDAEDSARAERVAPEIPREVAPRPSAVRSFVATSELPLPAQDDEPVLLLDEEIFDIEIEIDTPAELGARERKIVRSSGRSASDLAAETRILRAAQAKLRSGSTAAAQALLDEHRREYPRGLLTDLRTALDIDTHCRRGRHDRARAMSRSFAQQYPNSPYRARVRDCDASGSEP